MSVALCITEGGDDRLTILPELGMNKYNVPNVPTHGISRGSCTSSMPTDETFEVGNLTLAKIMQQGGAELVANDILQRLRNVWALGKHIAFTLFPSGTDAEFLFVLLALGRAFDTNKDGKVLSIVTCAGEVGSGTTKAAAGCHFSTLLPSGSNTKVGESIFPAEASNVGSVEVALRNLQGDLRTPEDVDAEVEQLVVDALKVSGMGCCVLHLVTGCKTGHSSPSLALCKKLQNQFGDRILIVVDGCQSRMRDGAISDFLATGFGVMVTGSKFYGGPPFCGAALMNADLAKEFNRRLGVEGLRTIVKQSSLKDYLNAPLVDGAHLPNLKELLPCSQSLVSGVLVRWDMALLNIEQYHSIPNNTREKLIIAWASEVRAIIEQTGSRALSVLPNDDLHPDAVSAGLLSCNSIISLCCRVQVNGQWREPTVDELKHAHKLMALDLGAHCGNCNQQAAHGRCFIAQPVTLGKQCAPVLRVALGAPQIIRAFKALGEVGAQNGMLAWPCRDEDEAVVQKLAFLLEHWDKWKDVEPRLSNPDIIKYKFRLMEPHLHGTLSADQILKLLQKLGLNLSAKQLTGLLQNCLGTPLDAADMKTVKVEYERFIDYLSGA